MNNLYISIFIILLIICIIIAFVFFFKQKKYINQEFFSNNNQNNLLKNPSFSNGNHIEQYSINMGKHDIIVFPNSGASSYVLRQSKNKKLNTNNPIYYRIELELKPNTIYYLGCLYYSTTNLPLINKVSFNNNDTIFLKTKLDSNKNPSNSDFTYLYCLFKTPSTTSNIHTTIDLSFNYNNIQGFNYITDIYLSEMLENNDLPYTDNLRCYFNCYNPNAIEKNRKVIKDISGNGFDFTSSTPNNIELGDFILSNNIIKGPNAFQLQNANMLKLNPSFSFFLLIRGIPQRIGVESFSPQMEEEESLMELIPQTHNTIILIPGNQNNAVSLLLPDNYGHIYLKVGDSIFKTDIQTPVYLDNMISITYNGHSITLFLDEEPILSTVCPRIYFDNQPIKINPSGNYNGKFYAFAYYNSHLSEEQVRKISRYFLKMKANGGDITVNSSKIINDLPSFIIPAPQPPISLTAQQPIPSEEEDSNCPKAIFEDGHYYVIIPAGSKLATTVGYSGIRDYGTNIDTAKQIFEINFPKCPLPNILDKRKYKADLSNCPFVMLVPENPCNQYDCRNTQWDKGTVKNKNCKRSIDVYCSKYSEVDPACFCWKKENWNKPECLKWRGQFEAEDKCDFRKHNIKDHPDFNKYIQKDKIPCWGCNLSAPESTSNNYACRPGSGAR